MNRKLYRTTGRIVRRELRAMVDAGVIRDARVRVGRSGAGCLCRITSHTTDGSPITVEAIDATRARAVRTAVRRLRDRASLFESDNPFAKENENDNQHGSGTERARHYVGTLPRRRIGRRFRRIEDGWTIRP